MAAKLAISDLLVRQTPFGRPVEPDVICKIAGRSIRDFTSNSGDQRQSPAVEEISRTNAGSIIIKLFARAASTAVWRKGFVVFSERQTTPWSIRRTASMNFSRLSAEVGVFSGTSNRSEINA
jgi:hypothetical protein